jgi:hypothetical protein
MPSTFTPFLNLEKPGQGEQTNLWGTTLNSNFDKTDAGVKANNTAVAVIPGMQSQIAALQSSDSTQTSNITTIQGQITTLQGQITTIQGQISTLQSQMGTANSGISTLQGQMVTANNNIAANTSAISTNAGNISANTSQINSLNSQITQCWKGQILTWTNVHTTNGSTMHADWVVLTWPSGFGSFNGMAWGNGQWQEGDTIVMPNASFVDWQMQCFLQNSPSGGPVQNIVVQTSGLQLVNCYTTITGTGQKFGRGYTVAGFDIFAWH